MGSSSGKDSYVGDPAPPHSVTVSKAFYIGTTEVTQGQWYAVSGINPSHFSSCGDTCPVEMVSWNDIQTFLTTLNAKGEGLYRLPTEAEWEYAARAGTTGPYSYDESNRRLYAWYGGANADSNSSYSTHPVATKLPNPWGLYDMHGNVSEWVQDWEGPYTSSPVIDPRGAEEGTKRVNRGGSWNSRDDYLRVAMRSSGIPESRSKSHGFRLVRAVP